MLAYYNGATAVMTDTFHGTIFSIIFNKQFISVVKEKNKIWNLLDAYNLQDRMFDKRTKISDILDKSICYNEVCEMIKKDRIRSRRFLDSAMQKERLDK